MFNEDSLAKFVWYLAAVPSIGEDAPYQFEVKKIWSLGQAPGWPDQSLIWSLKPEEIPPEETGVAISIWNMN